jgi:hypothetical protein
MTPVPARHGPLSRLFCDDGPMGLWSDAPDEEGRAPICPYCGVTTLPAELSHVLDSDFVCDNADCEAYGERID